MTNTTSDSRREPPHNLDLERAVLAVLLDGRHAVAMQKVRPLAPHPLLFWSRDHRLVYLACLEIDDEGHTIDAQAVAEMLSRLRFDVALERLRQAQALFESDELDRIGRERLRQLWRWKDGDRATDEGASTLAAIGGSQAVFQILDAAGSNAAIERNAKLLRDYYLKRRYVFQLSELCDHALMTTDSFSDLVDQASQSVLHLGQLDHAAAIHDMETVVRETRSMVDERRASPRDGLTTGLPGIDRHLGPFRPGGLYVLAARPGVGKTSLALRIVQDIVDREEHEDRVLFYSLEVSRQDLIKKVIAAKGSIEFQSLDSGKIDDPQYQRFMAISDHMINWPLEIMDAPDLTVHQIRSSTKRRMLETQQAIKLVVVDYLQLLKASRSDQDEYAKICEITRVLKVMAMELHVPVLALSQMSRDSEKASVPREPRLSDLRGSGSIEQDADAVLFIHRVDADEPGRTIVERNIKVLIAKNRFGPLGQIAMLFNPNVMSFTGVQDENTAASPMASRARSAQQGASSQGDRDFFK